MKTNIKKPSKKEINQFNKDWGQEETEICCCLGYDEDDEGTSGELMADGYFWNDDSQLWLNQEASGFSEREQEIADFLRLSN